MKPKSLIAPVCRAAAVFLLTVMLGGALCSCGVIILNGTDGTSEPQDATTVVPETSVPDDTGTEETTGEDETTDAPPPETTEKPDRVTFPAGRQEEAQSRLDELIDDIDISNSDIIVACASETVNVLFPDEDSVFYSSRMERNSMLYDKYKVDIRTLSIYENAPTTDILYADIAAALKAGDNASIYLDLIMVPASQAGRFLAGGLLRDMRTLPFYDTKEGNTAGNVGQARYFDLGLGTDTPEYLYAVYFNRSMLGADSSDELFRASMDGSLTFEMMLTAAKKVEGTDADIACEGGRELFGDITASLLGISFISKNSSGIPKLALTEGELSLLDSAVEMLSGYKLYAPAEGAPSAREAFASGKTPFYIGTLGEISELYDEPVEWGLLTLPSEHKLGAVCADRPVVCLPATNTRLEQTGLWLSALNAASGEWIADHFRDTLFKDCMRDNDSCIILGEILSRKAELGFETIYAGYYSGLADATYGALGGALGEGAAKFSEEYAKKLSALNKKLAILP